MGFAPSGVGAGARAGRIGEAGGCHLVAVAGEPHDAGAGEPHDAAASCSSDGGGSDYDGGSDMATWDDDRHGGAAGGCACALCGTGVRSCGVSLGLGAFAPEAAGIVVGAPEGIDAGVCGGAGASVDGAGAAAPVAGCRAAGSARAPHAGTGGSGRVGRKHGGAGGPGTVVPCFGPHGGDGTSRGPRCHCDRAVRHVAARAARLPHAMRLWPSSRRVGTAPLLRFERWCPVYWDDGTPVEQGLGTWWALAGQGGLHRCRTGDVVRAAAIEASRTLSRGWRGSGLMRGCLRQRPRPRRRVEAAEADRPGIEDSGASEVLGFGSASSPGMVK